MMLTVTAVLRTITSNTIDNTNISKMNEILSIIRSTSGNTKGLPD